MKKIFFILALTSTSVFSSDSDSIEDPCNSEHGGATAGYLCVAKKMEDNNTGFEKAYQGAMDRLKAEEEWYKNNSYSKKTLVEPFLEAHRAWVKYRDTECNFVGITLTSSPWQGVQIEECKLRMNQERVEYLNKVNRG